MHQHLASWTKTELGTTFLQKFWPRNQRSFQVVLIIKDVQIESGKELEKEDEACAPGTLCDAEIITRMKSNTSML